MAIAVACQKFIDMPEHEGNEGEEPLPALIPRQDIELSSVEQQLSVQSHSFAFSLLKTVYENEETDKNILLSPLSASLAFSMLNNGAADATQEEIQQTLGFGDVSSKVINSYAQKVVNAMQTLDTRAVFESANSIWLQTGFPVIDAFKQVNQQYYHAEIQNVNFRKPETLNLINKWANDQTHGKIPEILTEIPLYARFILANALYFKGYWTVPFDKKLTVDSQFHTSTGSVQVVPTMRNTLYTSLYAKSDNCAALELPFGNEAFSLVVVLPDEDIDVSTVVGQMNGDWWMQVIKGLESSSENMEAHLEIPRFKIDYERSLCDDLMTLGMKSPFDKDVADFSLLSSAKPLFISDVFQKTFAQMNEDGMVAAAVTVLGDFGLSDSDYTPVDFKVNRPFLYFIKEKSTGLVLFAGVINKIK